MPPPAHSIYVSRSATVQSLTTAGKATTAATAVNCSKKHTAKLKTGGGSGDGGNRLNVNGPCGQQQQQSKVNVSVTHRKRER